MKINSTENIMQKVFMEGGTLNLGYFADGPWGHNTLKKLLSDKSINIKFICVRFENKDEVLINLGKQYNIDILCNKNINSEEFISILNQYNCDLFVSMSFNQIFRKEIINLTPLKIINCHAGKLPFYRGRNILNWVLINDEKEFGITVHYVDEGIDTGDIILQRTYNINDNDNYKTLLDKAYIECANILYDAIKLIQNNKVNTIKQNSIHKVGSYFGIRQKGDEIIDWNMTSRYIFNFVRAICEPGPKATSYINNKVIKINKVKIVEDAIKYKSIPGQVVGKSKEKSFYVKTLDTIVEVLEYEYDGIIKIGDRLSR